MYDGQPRERRQDKVQLEAAYRRGKAKLNLFFMFHLEVDGSITPINASCDITQDMAKQTRASPDPHQTPFLVFPGRP
jgi:hypothetical protein